MDWATEACKRAVIDHTSVENRKQQLGDCFELIRFPTMSSQDFSKCVEEQNGVLSVAEVLDILSHLTLGNPLKVATRFSEKPRRGIPAWTVDKSIRVCDRRSLPNLCRVVDYDRDVIRFSVNEKLLLGQISLSNFETIPHRTALKSGELYIRTKATTSDIADSESFDEEASQLLLSQTVQISTDGSSKVQFDKPIILEPFQDYQIETKWSMANGERLIFRTQCHSEVMLDGGIRFQFKHVSNSPFDSVSDGLVSRLYFKRW